ncbi:MAG TPA: chromate transporter [Anaerolineales bacterium]|jgi:chromate transporter|nr:chromate transporter [Anaerolineales bacterium]HNQ94325.1 chromate transporter [Anaerolineales bacterium]HNS60739.1 chromate transporter [Anaerolineales bacterium]
MNESKISVWVRLLWMFLKVNILSPSGPASIGFLYDEAVGKLMTEERFVEAVGFSNVLPGSEALKLAMFVGFAAGGIPGVFAALLGAILPPTVLMLIVASLLQRFQGEDWLASFVAGMSPAVAALIVVVGWELFRAGSRKKIDRRVILIALLSAVAFWFEIPSPFVLLGAGVLGVILFGKRGFK